MAYSEIVVAAVTDIPAHIAAFAEARGWARSGNLITRPGGGRQFSISASIGGLNNRERRLFVTDVAIPARRTWTQMPWTLGTPDNPVQVPPTKIHLFGNDDPWAGAPYICCVIECGYNAYRHVYIGNLVKFGNYTGGEVICSNYWISTVSGNQQGALESFDTTSTKRMFEAHHDAGSPANTGPVGLDAGGANIVHADNANSWRYFDGPSGSNARSAMTGLEVFGGAGDSINSGLLMRGVSDYAGANILVPINLYCPDSANIGANVRFRPVGYVAGVRMVNMRGLDPGEIIKIGNDNWRVFPEFSKRDVTGVFTGGATSYYPPYETSYMLGLAYPEAG